MEPKSNYPKIRKGQLAKDLGYSSSTLQRYRHDIKMRSPYMSSCPRRTQRPQMT